MKIKLDGVITRLDTAEEISQLEHKVICNIQYALQENKKSRKMNKILMSFGVVSCSPNMTSQKWRKKIRKIFE